LRPDRSSLVDISQEVSHTPAYDSHAQKTVNSLISTPMFTTAAAAEQRLRGDSS
jgi:hypothetical protein